MLADLHRNACRPADVQNRQAGRPTQACRQADVQNRQAGRPTQACRQADVQRQACRPADLRRQSGRQADIQTQACRKGDLQYTYTQAGRRTYIHIPALLAGRPTHINRQAGWPHIQSMQAGRESCKHSQAVFLLQHLIEHAPLNSNVGP
jgi:hypothetical protein